MHARAALKKICLGGTPWVYVYVVLIPLVNWSFAHVPTFTLPGGGEWAPMTIVTGLVLVFRDLAQREVGHWIFLPLVIGLVVSYFMAPHAIALASAAAFGISETIDWAVFTITKRPLSKRVLLSCFCAAPVDSVVFWMGAEIAIPGIFNGVTLATSVASKLFGAWVVYLMLKHREKRLIQTPA